jgi:alkanesulfonate monooxygenase SsuD/methylene tetrahydromethanopterin reductase-like flavin-dependent oxidoreductase (luciferase family)
MFGEDEDQRIRARKLDEGLAILNGLWRGQPFSFQGEFYKVGETTFLPKPIQLPRIPVWVGGGWNKRPPMRRAARWDGFFPLKWRETITVDEWREILDYLEQHRTGGGSYDLVQGGVTPGNDPVLTAKIVEPFNELGLTWWIEHIDPWRFGLGWEDLVTPEASEKMAERIRQGPPKS